MEDSAEEVLGVVENRVDLLEELEGGHLDPRGMRDRLDTSRATVNRAVRSLEDAGLIERVDGGYGLTSFGRLALDHYREYRREWTDLHGARELLSELPGETPVTRAVADGADVVTAPTAVPYLPEQRLHRTLRAADRIRAVLPVLVTAEGFRLLYEHVVTDGNEAELVVGESLYERLHEQFPRRLAAMLDTDGFELRVGETPRVGVVVTETDGDRAVSVAVFDGEGNTGGLLRNDGEAAVRWGDRQCDRARADGAPPAEHRAGAPASAEHSGDTDLPVALKREGFVRLTSRFFALRRVSDPTTAWRSGIGFAEVHTGYVVDRTDGDGRSLADGIRSGLRDGTDQVLVGPPGSGKSTVLKQVATEWYDRDLGPVLYRESDRGRSVESVDALEAAAANRDGVALVVVEDAAKPDAAAVFDAAERLADRDDVRLLFDAHAGEWRDLTARRSTATAAGMDVVTMPRLDAEDYERFRNHVDRVVDEPVGVSVDRLREAVRERPPSGAGESAAPGTVAVLLHRLAGAVDPTADDPSTLEAAVEDTYRRLATAGDDALDVGALVNLLNAAGLDVHSAYCHAVVEDPEAVETALDELAGRVLFDPTERGYDTAHETWSRVFLSHLVETDDRARARLTGCLDALLSLVEDADRRAAVAERGDATVPDRLAEAPTGWAEDLLAGVFTLAREQPDLAPLVATADGPAVAVPDDCDRGFERRVTLWAGQALLAGGYYDRADEVFATLAADDDPSLEVERALGRVEVARNRGEFGRATDHAEAALETAVDPVDRARARTALAGIAVKRGEYDRAVANAETARDAFEAADDPGGTADSLRVLGDVAKRRDRYDAAREHYEAALSAERAVGSRIGAADALDALGRVAFARSDYERAVERFRESLDVRRERGDRRGVATCLKNLGAVERVRGDVDAARDHLERSVETASEIGYEEGIAEARSNLGTVMITTGDYEAARTHYERALETLQSLDRPDGVAKVLHNLGTLTERCGEYDEARDHYRRAIEYNHDLANERAEAGNRHGLAYIAREQGDYGRAREEYERSLEIYRTVGDTHSEARSLDNLGEVALRRGNYERAQRLCAESLELEKECSHEVGAAHTLANLGEIARQRGNDDLAADRLKRALDRYEDLGESRGVAAVELSLARIALADDRPDEARDRAEHAREALSDTDARIWLARTDRVLGRVAARSGDRERASDRLRAALETFELLGAAPDTVETLRHLVEVTVEDDRVERLCTRAVRTLEEVDSDTEDERLWFERACPDSGRSAS